MGRFVMGRFMMGEDAQVLVTSGLAAGVAASAWVAAAWAVRGRSSQVFGPSAWHGNRSTPSIALTFDDGPSRGTAQVLELLQQYRIPATFFQCGANVQALPSVAKEVYDAGHEIGNHSFSHPLFAGKRSAMIVNEFSRAQSTIVDATGQIPRWLRAPYGVRWFGFHRVPLKGVMWDVIGNDWKLPANEITHRVLRGTRNGSILCLHDGRELDRNAPIENTLEALRCIVPCLLERGFQFQTVSQLLCQSPCPPLKSPIKNSNKRSCAS